jgi:hypothetical protein
MWFNQKRYLLTVLALLVMLVAAYVAGLFVDVTRDAGKYASVAREVYESGDFINLRVHGEPYDQKPPMLFWLSALSFYIFGLSNFAFKVPLLLTGFLGIYSTYRLGKSLYNVRVGMTAAMMLAASQVYFLYYMDIHTDSVLQPFVTFALWQLYEFIKKNKNVHLILGFSGIGCAMLTKGPVGALVPAFAVLGHLVFTRQYERLLDIRWYLGALLTLILILPALAGLYNQFGWEGIRFYFWTNNAGRLTGQLGAHRPDYFFYVHNLLYLFFPWMLLLFVSAGFEFRSLIERRFRGREFYIFPGTWLFFLILTLSKGKLPNYIFVLMPLFSLLTAKYAILATGGRRPSLFRLFLRLQSVSVVFGSLVVAAIILWLFPANMAVMFLPAIIMIFVISFALNKRNTNEVRLFLPPLAVAIVLNLYINMHVAPRIFSDQASVKAAAIFNAESGPGDKIHNYNYESHELFFYAVRPAVKVINDVTVIRLMQEPGNWVLTERKVVERLEGDYPEPDIIPLEHVWLNKLSLKYLNPRTRSQATDTLFLLRSTAVGPNK